MIASTDTASDRIVRLTAQHMAGFLALLLFARKCGETYLSDLCSLMHSVSPGMYPLQVASGFFYCLLPVSTGGIHVRYLPQLTVTSAIHEDHDYEVL
jgi:hypothetical protein